MSQDQDYGIDNQGAGFVTDDGDDLDSMLSAANQGAEDDDVDTSHYFTDSDVDSPAVGPVNATTVPEPGTVVAPEPEPMVSPEPLRAPARVSMRSEADDITEAGRVIRVLDTYRSLNSDTRSVVSQFIHNDNSHDPNDEALLVVRTLRADPMLAKCMRALGDSTTEKDRVKRVFYILRLPTDVLHSLGELVSMLSDSDLGNRNDQLAYAQSLENQVEGLDSKTIEYVKATQSVLDAAEVPQGN